MRAMVVAMLTGAALGTLLLAGSYPAPAAADAEVLKCVDCENLACHAVYFAASRNCTQTPDGCMAWEDCGSLAPR
jgi:hypothetical protein